MKRTDVVVVFAALSALLLRLACQLNFVDVDLFHEMALARAAFALGHIPRDDIFAFTPTLHPTVHHEWGTGVVLYVVSMVAGGPGLIALKYLLVAGIAFFTVKAARLRGAPWETIGALAPAAALLVQNGLTTIRAQVFTMLFTAILMALLEQDRRGKRLWILPWLVAHLIWLNMHAGFLVGTGLLAVHWLEQVIRTKKPQPHLIAGGLAMAALVLVNPWGMGYVHYLFAALTMTRIVGEWKPIWVIADSTELAVYVFSLVLVAYCALRLGWKKIPGILVVVLCAYLGAKTVRHVTFYAVAWLAHVPAWVAATPLGETIVTLWNRRNRGISYVAAVVGILLFGSAILTHPFTLRINTDPNADASVVEVAYPAGATRYLAEQHFQGNVLTHFNVGSFVSWSLYPPVKVGLDSRYEVAYPTAVVTDMQTFYLAQPGWETTLTKYPADLALVTRSRPIAALMRTKT
ncbi:MAG: hypothetical protein ABI461_15190, partial [Polyangiaceae bacterium]